MNAVTTWSINQQAQTLTIRATLARTFVDNTYGTNIIGWPGSHSFSNLTGSDQLQLALYDNNGVKKLDFDMDYMSSSATFPSGYGTLGVSGGEGNMNFGSASDVLNVKTSLSENFNTFGYVLTSNSPATDANYTPNAAQPNWIFDVWYEATVKLSAFGASGFGFPDIASIHASPSKTGNNSEPVDSVHCIPPCVPDCDGTVNLTVTSGTGPFTFQWSNGATTEDIVGVCGGIYTVTITDAGGCTATVTDTVPSEPCNDEDPCTVDECVDNECVFTPIVCDDDNGCTTEICVEGECVTSPFPCDDGDECTIDECVNDECDYTPVVCNDEDLCTTDLCVDGECEFTPVVCNDFNLCTSDLCVNGQCQFTPIVCNDQDMCTFDFCIAGDCLHPPINCGDNNTCTVDECIGTGLCVHTPLACNDNDGCTIDICTAGVCQYTPIVCTPDTDPCTNDLCVGGICKHPVINCGDNDACTIDECINGECVHTPVACNDNNACTIDLCVDGACQSTPVVCTPDTDPCTNDFCLGGICKHPPIVCNDNSTCTSDQCVNGECVFTPINCNDNNPCTSDECVNDECVFTPIGIDLTVTSTDVTCACVPSASGICLLDFAGLEHGRMLNTQYEAFGIHISAVANPPGVDTLIIFNSFVTGTADPDLEVDAGNLAIIPLNITGGADGIVDNPNDNIDGGVITLTFDQPRTVTSFVIVDVDHLDGDPHAIAYDVGDNVLIDIAIPILGDGSVQTVVLNQAGVSRLEINTNNSIGVTDFIFDCDTTECCDGTASAEASGPAGPFTYVWSTGATTSSIDSLCPGEYCVTATGANGCQTVECVIVGQDSCSGPCVGVVCDDENLCTNDVCVGGECQYTARMCEDDEPCTLDFCNEANGECVFMEIPGCGNPCEGIDCDDQDACTSDTCINGQCDYTPSDIAADANGTDPTDCGSCDGTASVTPSGGTPPYTYLWSTGDTTQSISGSPAPPFEGTEICINTGGLQYIHSNGDTFVADNAAYYSGSTAGFANTNAAIANTTDDLLYQTERNATPSNTGSMTYSIPVINGPYDVELHFAEIFYGAPSPGTNSNPPHTGKRLFDVSIEGVLVLDNYDIVAEAGSAAAIVETFTTTVNDGFVTIFFQNVLNRAKISGICVRPHQEQGGVQGLCAGTYSVTVTDANGCTATDDVTLTPPGCDDGDPCTIDVCEAGECSNTPVVCDDGDACTIDACVDGGCVYTPVVCDDGDACTIDACVDGACIYTPVVCDDGDACTIDACVDGACDFTPVVCNDGDVCTDDVCVDGACEYTEIPGCTRIPCVDEIPCIDGDLCTEDICVDGFCQNPPIVCDDQDACTTEECIDGDCVFTDVVCDDGDACTEDACVDGQCEYTAIVCDDGDACTEDACVDGECEYTAIVCDDGDACTEDACIDGQCEYTAIVCDDGDDCTSDACEDGECVFNSIPGCGEGNPCAPDFCDDGNPCTVDILDGSGACIHTPVTNTPDYLRIVNNNTNLLNLKILYGPTGAWINQNVAAGGNNMLCITMRDATPLPDSVARVHIRLKGSGHTEATRLTNNYPFGCVPREWTTICIPLSAFPTTNFTAVPYVEIFNSSAAPYEFHILKIEFTGGATPFLWFGPGKTDNYVAGSSASFNATLVTGTPCNGAPKLSQTDLNAANTFAPEFSALSAYPNPFENQLTVEFTSEFEGTADLKMVDVLGQVVKLERVSVMTGANKQELNLDGTLANGIYFLEMRMNNQVRYVKLMK